MPDARNFGDGLMNVPHYGPDRARQAELRLAELLRRKPVARVGDSLCAATTNAGQRRGGTYLCWLPDGHDGWHLNPHFHAWERPAGWFVNRARSDRGVPNEPPPVGLATGNSDARGGGQDG